MFLADVWDAFDAPGDSEVLDGPVVRVICKSALWSISQLDIPTRQRNLGRWRASLLSRIGTEEARSEEDSSDASEDGLSTRSVKPMLNALGKEESSEGGSNLGVNPDW
jgi:hypothetical protein